MSINRAQAEVLADGFLDNLGSGKDGLQPRESYTTLFLLAGEFIEDAQQNLNNSNSNASGALSRSLEIQAEENGTTVRADIFCLYYGDFINSGVKGIKSGNGKYAFKTAFPSRKMVEALEKNIGRAKLSTRNTDRRSVSKNENKNLDISARDKAYAVGRRIKLYGIKANGFIDKAFKTTEQKVADRLGNAFAIDIINTLPDNLNEL